MELSPIRMTALIVLIVGAALIGFLIGKGYGEKNVEARIKTAEKVAAEAALENAKKAANPFEGANPLRGATANPYENVRINPFE